MRTNFNTGLPLCEGRQAEAINGVTPALARPPPPTPKPGICMLAPTPQALPMALTHTSGSVPASICLALFWIPALTATSQHVCLPLLERARLPEPHTCPAPLLPFLWWNLHPANTFLQHYSASLAEVTITLPRGHPANDQRHQLSSAMAPQCPKEAGSFPCAALTTSSAINSPGLKVFRKASSNSCRGHSCDLAVVVTWTLTP